MDQNQINNESLEEKQSELFEVLPPSSEFSRRDFVKILGAGILISMSGDISLARRSSTGALGNSKPVIKRFHIGTDGVITVMTGKVELGQGSRTELTQAAAEELRVKIGDIRMVMADTDITPDDGSSSGSRTTPSTVPKMRRECATARKVLVNMVAEKWQVNSSSLKVSGGKIVNILTNQMISYSELAKEENLTKS